MDRAPSRHAALLQAGRGVAVLLRWRDAPAVEPAVPEEAQGEGQGEAGLHAPHVGRAEGLLHRAQVLQHCRITGNVELPHVCAVERGVGAVHEAPEGIPMRGRGGAEEGGAVGTPPDARGGAVPVLQRRSLAARSAPLALPGSRPLVGQRAPPGAPLGVAGALRVPEGRGPEPVREALRHGVLAEVPGCVRRGRLVVLRRGHELVEGRAEEELVPEVHPQ
mmetsp:Transcript_102182/g.298025  ORF Transcript_102182/g.298025 Transcript_102182/m.298025 type:complete len:220 (-) Transcript_102182:201-860(-)